MNNTLELILNKLNDIQDNVKQLNDKINALEETTTILKQDIQTLREETKQGIEQLDCNINTTRRVLTEQVYKNTVEIEHLRIVK